MDSQDNLKFTPLFESHVALGAKMVPFGGWSMPLQYEGILAEYKHTRECVSLFDISHMGEFMVEGDLKESGLDSIVTMPLSDLPVKACRYGAILNEQGGVIDDTIVFRIDARKWFVVVNGATTQKDALHFKKHLTDKARFEDLSPRIGKLDLQGPRSREVLAEFVQKIGRLNYYTFDYFKLMGENVIISRTGYTGELGYEIYFPWDKTRELWDMLLANKLVKPAGLGARDVLRIEMGYSLYGHELEENISPLESGLNRFIDFNKNFIGKEALLKQTENELKRSLVGIASQTRRAPRAGQTIFSKDEQDVGVVTSGTFSPAVEHGIGLGFVNKGFDKIGNKIYFGNNKIKNDATVSKKAFYSDSSLKT